MSIDINNWGHPDQRAKLTELIRTLGVHTIIEIGSYIGASAAFFASHAEVKSVTCIDPFEATGDWAREVREAGVPVRFYETFKRNLIELGLWDKIIPLPGTSQFWADIVDDADMVYIDGPHDYDSCASDIRLYFPKARKVIAGDDHHFDEHGKPYFPGVVRACQELLPGYEHNSRMWWKVI